MPYDIEGVFWSHRGDLCTFDVLPPEFRLSPQGLDLAALILCGADAARVDLAPERAALIGVPPGLSRLHSDSPEQLKTRSVLCDPCHRWARNARDKRRNRSANSGNRT